MDGHRPASTADLSIHGNGESPMNAPDLPGMPRLVCTTSEAARRLGVSSTTVQVMVERGELMAWRTRGGHRRISVASVDAIRRQRGVLGERFRSDPTTLCVLVVEEGGQTGSCAGLIRGWDWPINLLTAMDGLEAVLMIERYRPSVVILDLTTPGLNGPALVRKVREHHEFDAVHLVAMLAEGGAQPSQDLRLLPGVAVFSKPMSIERLQGFVEAHLIRQAPPQRSQGGEAVMSAA